MSARRAAGRVLLALLMISSVVVASSGTAAADTTISTDCSIQDVAVGGLYTVVNQEDRCGLYNDRAEELAKNDAQAAAVSLGSRRESYQTVRRNQAENLDAILYMQGKAAAIEALNNGATEAEAKEAWNETVYNYTSLIIRNSLNDYGARASQAAYLANQTGNDSEPPIDDITGRTYQVTYNLPNDENVTVATVMSINSGNPATPLYRMVWSGHPLSGTGPGQIHMIEVVGPDGQTWTDESQLIEQWAQADWSTLGDDVVVTLLQGQQFEESSIRPVLDAQNRSIDNGERVVSNIYENYSAGEISTEDLWDPVTAAQEASTERGTTGYYAFSNAELAALGYTGDTNVTHVVETQITTETIGQNNSSVVSTTHNATIEGSLFLTDGEMSLTTGQTYDPSNLSGSVYMTVATAENDTGAEIRDMPDYIQIEDSFTIRNATDARSGEEVAVTEADDSNYESYNSTQVEKQLAELRRIRYEIEQSRSDPVISGGGDGQQTQEASLLSDILPSGAEDLLESLGVAGLLESLGIGLGIGSAAVAVGGLFILGRVLG